MRYSLFILLFSLISFSLFGQTVESLKSQRAKSEKEITKLNNLLEEAKKSKNSSMQQISLYDKKIKETNNVIGTLNRELNTLNSNIDKNNASIESFEQQREKLLDLYERTVYEQWKVRNFENQFLYILASESFDQAYRRFRYYKEMKNFTKDRVKEIARINDSLTTLNSRNRELLDRKVAAKMEVNNLQRSLNNDKNREQQLLSSI